MDKSYETNVKPYLDEITKWRQEGAKIEWIAKKLNIGESTFYRYKSQHKELQKALLDAEPALYEGMTLTAEDTIYKKLIDRYEISEEILEEWKDEAGKVIKTHTTTKKKLIPADARALIFALERQKSEKWNKDEKEFSDARLEKIKAQTALIQSGNLAEIISEKLNTYLGSNNEE